MKRDLLGVVLCGGRSSRMGSDKADLQIRPGRSQLQYILELLDLVVSERAVSVGSNSASSLRVPAAVARLPDPHGLSGPMAGLIAALRFAAGKPVLLCACDMPFLEERHLIQLVNRRNPERLATAFLAEDGAPEPLCAIYESSCLPTLERNAAMGRASLRRFLIESCAELARPDDPRALASVNTPAEAQAARRRFDTVQER